MELYLVKIYCGPNAFLLCRCVETAPDASFFFFFPPLFALLSADKQLHILSRPALDETSDASRRPSVEDVTQGEASSAPGTPKFTPEAEGGSSNILAYVSVLAAVVLGLFIYVGYKW